MNSNEYGLAMMLLFIAYVFAQVPSNLYLAKGRPSIYLPTAMVLWGCVCTSTAFVRTPGALYAVRFLLGLLEAPFCVGCLFLISSWYTRTELGLRSAILLSAPMMANAFTGVIAFGIHDSIDGAYGLEGWRWLFIVGGSITIVMACIAFFTLPDYPHNTRWLYEEERALAQLRLVADRGASEYDVSRFVGLKMALNSWQVWTFAGMYFLLAIGTSLHNFFPSVVQTLGFSRNTTLWMTAPPYLLAVVIAISTALSADRLRNASFHIIGTATFAIVGFLLFLLEQSTDRGDIWARYASTFLMIAGAHAANPIVLGWAQKTVRQPREMRATAIAIVNTSGTIAQVSHDCLSPLIRGVVSRRLRSNHC
jgi:MFS family permease